MKKLHLKSILALLAILLAACTPSAAQVMEPTEDLSGFTPGSQLIPSCELMPVKAPRLPNELPGYAQLDESTGLHFTGGALEIDPETYHLKVTGLVERPLLLTYDDLRCLPRVTTSPLLVCRGYFEDQADWTGTPINAILALAKPQPKATRITLVSADGYTQDVLLETALLDENILAYTVNGQTLPALHGFPLRAVLPKREGNFWVKWIVEIRVK